MTKHQYNKQGWNRSKRSRRKDSLLSRFGIQGLTVKNIILLGIALAFAGSIALLAFMAILSRNLPNPNSLTERTVSQTTKIYDRTGDHVLYEILAMKIER